MTPTITLRSAASLTKPAAKPPAKPRILMPASGRSYAPFAVGFILLIALSMACYLDKTPGFARSYAPKRVPAVQEMLSRILPPASGRSYANKERIRPEVPLSIEEMAGEPAMQR